MIVPSTGVRVLVATWAVDFRMGMDGLGGVYPGSVEDRPVLRRHLCVPRQARRPGEAFVLGSDRGCLLTKRLKDGTFRWPTVQDGVMRLSPAQLSALQIARAHKAHLATERDTPAAKVGRLIARDERLDHIISVIRRAHFGRSSERLSEDQIVLALEDVEASRRDARPKRKATSAGARRQRAAAPIAAICRRICRARRSSSSRSAGPVHAAAPCMSSARMSRSGSTGSRRGCESSSRGGRNMPADPAPTVSSQVLHRCG